MKKIVLSLFFILFSIIAILACDISITVQGQHKDKYKTGDEIVLKVRVSLLHKNCAINISDTKFNQEGVKIISGTEWVKVEPTVWERTIKLQITAKHGEKAKFSVVRPCPAGIEESIEFKV